MDYRLPTMDFSRYGFFRMLLLYYRDSNTHIMAIDAVKIPQNVYVEDHIIGPVTLKQLLITGLGCGISYVIYASVVEAGYTSLPIVIVCWIPAMISAAFAFFKINDLSLFNIILLMIESINKPSQRFWSPHGGISINLITSAATKEIAEADAKVATNAARLADVTRQLEQRQEAMNRLTSHDVPTPDDVEPIKTKLEKRLAQDAAVETETTSASTLPVNKKRVVASGLDQSRSVDTIAHDLKAYEDQFAHTDQ